MSFSEVDVLRYIDKDMSSEERSLFEEKMKSNRELCLAVRSMKSSNLPYQEAMSTRSCSMPNSLHDFFDANCPIYGLYQQGPKKSYQAFRHLALTACVATFCFIAGFVSQTALREQAYDNVTLSSYGMPTKLFESMVNYQALHSRKTLTPVHQEMGMAEKLTNAYNTQNKTQIKIPNLTEHGYQFKRVSELVYKDKSILQFVYLPTKGEPITICVTSKVSKESMSSDSKSIINHENVNTVIWQNTNNVYMLIGKAEEDKLMPIAKTITL